MKALRTALVVMLVSCVGVGGAQAGENDLTGSIELDRRFRLSDSKLPMVDMYSKAQLELKRWWNDERPVQGAGQPGQGGEPLDVP